MAPRSTKDERDRALSMASNDVPVDQIAIALGRSTAIIRLWCKASNVDLRSTQAQVVGDIACGNAPTPRDNRGAVYFLAAESVDRVKVGFTRDRKTIVKRMSALAYSSPVTVTLMKVIAGSMQGERWLHAKWAEHRHHGEWFTLSAIRADIEALESVRDVSAEVEAAKACADCGVYRKGAKRGQPRCRACANKRGHEERARLREATRVRIIQLRCPCGTEISKSNKSGLCKPCAMRKAWNTDEYRAAIMPSRRRRWAKR